MSTHWSASSAELRRYTAELDDGLRHLLSIGPSGKTRLFSTFSGSASIERALAAVIHAAGEDGKVGVDVVLAEPCVDLFHRFARQSGFVRVVPVQASVGEPVVGAIIDCVQRLGLDSNRMTVLCLESPRNPIGPCLSRHDLRQLSAVCAETDALLVVDHCFLLAGVHEPSEVATLFSETPDCRWIALWDTGKTIDLNGDKLGVMITGDDEVASWVHASVATLQPMPALRLQAVFSGLVNHVALPEYIEALRTRCRQNRTSLINALTPGWTVAPSAAGAFACIVARGDTPFNVKETQRLLMDAGVAAVTSTSFYSTPPQTEAAFLRLSLAREAEYFAEAAQRITLALQCSSESRRPVPPSPVERIVETV